MTRLSFRRLCSRRLGVDPTDLSIAGAKTVNSIGRVRSAVSTVWRLESGDRVASLDLRDHIDWLKDALTPAAPVLLRLIAEDCDDAAVCCRWLSRFGHGGPILAPEQMLWLGSLGIELRFEVQFPESE